MPIHSVIHSEPGSHHANEDAVMVHTHPLMPEVMLCALADGQGGRAGGAAAARTAVEESLRDASAYSPKELLDPTTWYSILSTADEAVCESDEAGFTTLIALCVTEHTVSGASCGDSAVLLINDGQSVWLTEDQRKNPPVGSSAAIPTAFAATLKPNWKLLLLSDGVWRYIGFDAIGEIASRQHGNELVTALRQNALAADGETLHDDFTVAVLWPASPP